MRVKRPQGYKHIKCPHCGEKIRLNFRTLHRLRLTVEGKPPIAVEERVLEEGEAEG